ncbi:MAG: hypothetical protein OXF05_04265 [Hyphomicrobiales bacterium]|nr:hypothetical protein [Hyphomicrobiales bacterium]
MISQPVNLLRLTLIAFSLTLLVACGGGGSGGGTASPATMMPGTDDPTPMVMLEDLPTWTITDLDATRIAVNGTAPTSMTEAQIVRAIQTRASGADTFEFSDFVGGAASVDIVCNTNFSCSGDVPNVGMLTFSLRDIEDLSLVDDMNLVGFNSNSQAVMTHRGITAIQSIAAGRQSDGTQLTFQTYGGWGTGSVFGVELLDATQGATTTERFASFSFGNNTGRNPTANATWNGVMIGVAKDDGDIVQGNATIQWDDGTPNAVGGFFNTIKNLTDGGNYSTTLITWQNIPLRNGAFELDNADGSISGNFYGDNLEEVGGIFDREGIIGAFGGVQ